MPSKWPHPADDMDAPDEESANREGVEQFKALVQMCLPERGYGNVRRWAAGYNRFVVFAYEYASEMFSGMDKRELAQHMGLSYRAMMMEFEHVRRIAALPRPQLAEPKHETKLQKKGKKLPGPPPGTP